MAVEQAAGATLIESRGRDMRSLLPRLLVSELERCGVPPVPTRRTFPGALLFSDLSGYTAMSEELQRRGRGGAEELASILARGFRPALHIIDRAGGSVVNFAGDAIFAVFPGADGVARAVDAADQIAARFGRIGTVKTSAGARRLRLSQVIHYGSLVGLHLGTPASRRFVVCGPAVSTLARLEHASRPDEILLSRKARARREVRARPHPAPPARWRRAWDGYLPRHFRERRDACTSEFRRVAVLFVETRGWATRPMQRFLIGLERGLATLQGTLISTDVSDVGVRWLCVFGAPVTHEDDVARAGRFVLDLLDIPGAPALRAGMHVGVVANLWVGTTLRRSFEVLGDTVNTAARCLSFSRWGEALLTDVALSGSALQAEPRGQFAAKGKSRPLDLHRLIDARPRARPLRLSAPFVGRAREIQSFTQALALLPAGRGSGTAVIGEPGLGKSRLKWEVQRLAEARGVEILSGRAVPFGGTAYGALGEALRQMLGLERVAAEDVRGLARTLGMPDSRSEPLAEVMGAASTRRLGLDGRVRREENRSAVRELLLRQAARRPVLLALEDLHWADEATRDIVPTLLDAAREGAILLLILARPEFRVPDGFTTMRLAELTPGDVRGIVESLLPGAPARMVQIIWDRSGGNPLYVEEVLRHLVAEGLLTEGEGECALSRPLTPEDLPGSLESLIQDRLDRLSRPARLAARTGSVIGRTFAHELLLRVDPAITQPALDELLANEIVFVRTPAPPCEYVFKHALIRDAAYATLLTSERRRWHDRVAAALEGAMGVDRRLVVMLAHHHEMAKHAARAAELYREAGQQAVTEYRHQDAVDLVRSAQRLAPGPDRATIQSRIVLGTKSLRQLGRIDAAERELRRALEEARRIKDGAMELRSLLTLSHHLYKLGRMKDAERLAREALQLARRQRDDEGELGSLVRLANVLSDSGREEEAIACCEEGVAIGRRAASGQLAWALGILANLYTECGRTREAKALYLEALDRVRPGSDQRITLEHNLALLHLTDGELEMAEAGFSSVLEACRRTASLEMEGHVLSALGNLRSRQRRLEEAASYYRQAVDVQRRMGDGRVAAIVEADLADVLFGLGRVADARQLFERALAVARETGDLRFEGTILVRLARLVRWMDEDLPEATRMLDAAEALLVRCRAQLQLVDCICARGHVALCRAETAAPHLLRARKLARTAGSTAGAAGAGAGSLATLARAQAAFERSLPLVRGELPGDAPPDLLAWLRALPARP